MKRSIVTPWVNKKPRKVSDLYPSEFNYFTSRFIWPCNWGGFYSQNTYQQIGTFPKWRPAKSKADRWVHLYQNLANELAEKHLDYNRFCASNPKRKMPEYETAFWLGLMAGKHAYNDCIDIDSHDEIGWYEVPTRWCPEATGHILPGEHSYRRVPVVRPSLRFFQIAKIVFDAFPGRIWAFSSANLGLAVWKTYPKRELTHVVHDRCKRRFSKVGLPASLEHYPSPPTTSGSFGRCHRRPCGMDSGVITNDGVVVDSISQIRHFMKPTVTPSFEVIVREYFGQLSIMYNRFMKGGISSSGDVISQSERKELIAGCFDVVKQVKAWMKRDCPIDHAVLQDSGPPKSPTELPTAELRNGGEAASVPTVQGDYPDCFWNVDLREVNRSGRWIQFVKFLCEHGFPCEDKFHEVISTLAKWLIFVEFHGQEVETIQRALFDYVAKRHNGKVTRWQSGKKLEIFRHISRIVSSVIETESEQGASVFDNIRMGRATGRYKQQYHFFSQDYSPPSSLSSNEEQQSYLIRGGIRDESDKKEWSYIPDDSPLPDQLQCQILDTYKTAGRPLRKRDGRYSILDAITRFFNYLVSGRKSGQRRASKKLLQEMGFPSKTREQQAIINVLVEHGFVERGGYRSRQESRQWTLCSKITSLMIKA